MLRSARCWGASTAAAALLASGAGTSDPKALDRPAQVTVGTAVASAVYLVIAALMWSFMAADLSRAIARETTASHIDGMNWMPSIALIMGVTLFFVSIGASGWIASRKLGWVTTAMAVTGGIALLLMVLWFGEVRVG